MPVALDFRNLKMYYFVVRVLPPMSQDEDETVEEFAQRVQQTMAKALNIEATAHTSSDKVEYAKQVLFIQPQTGECLDICRAQWLRGRASDSRLREPGFESWLRC